MVYIGTGLTYDAGNTIQGGTITEEDIYSQKPALDASQQVASPPAANLIAKATGLSSHSQDTHEFMGNDTFDVSAMAATSSATIAVSGFAPGTSNAVISGADATTLIFDGSRPGYTISDNGDGSVTVTDSMAGRDGATHIVIGAAAVALQFTDTLTFVATPTETHIALLYQAALGRTPDAPGLTGWQNVFSNESPSAQAADLFTSLAGTPVSSLPDLTYGFTQSTEFQQKYGTLTNTQFVTQLYANVLDRAPDAAGLNGWVNALGQGHSREWVLVGFAESQEALDNAEVGFIGQTGTVHAPWLVVT